MPPPATPTLQQPGLLPAQARQARLSEVLPHASPAQWDPLGTQRGSHRRGSSCRGPRISQQYVSEHGGLIRIAFLATVCLPSSSFPMTSPPPSQQMLFWSQFLTLPIVPWRQWPHGDGVSFCTILPLTFSPPPRLPNESWVVLCVPLSAWKEQLVAQACARARCARKRWRSPLGQ